MKLVRHPCVVRLYEVSECFASSSLLYNLLKDSCFPFGILIFGPF